MKPFSLLYLLLIFFASLAAPAHAQSVHTYVDSDSLQVGDIFELTYVVEGVYSSLSYPTEDQFEDNLEVLSRQRFQPAANRDSLVYRIQFFGTENITIASKEITLHRSDTDTTLETNRVPLFFKTVLAEGEEEFRPFKPIFEFARSLWPFLISLLLLAIAGYLFYRWYTARETKPEPAPVSPPPPFENPLNKLLDQLSELPETSALSEMEDYEKYYIRLGDAIRLYIKRVYEFPALEMTTREIVLNLQKELASTEIIKITRSVLNEADMVKFANFRPSRELADNVLNKARQFAETARANDTEKIEYLRIRHEEKAVASVNDTASPKELKVT